MNKDNSTYHSTVTIKPPDAKNNTYINSGKKGNDKDPKLKFRVKYEKNIM